MARSRRGAVKRPDEFPRIALGIDEAAAAVGVSRKTLRRAIDSGRLPSAKVGARRLIRPADLTRWIDDALV